MSAVIQLCVLGGRQYIAAPCIVNAVIIMLYTPLSSLECVNLSVMLSQQAQNVHPMLV